MRHAAGARSGIMRAPTGKRTRIDRNFAAPPGLHAPRRPPKPPWLKVRAPGGPSYIRLKGLMREWNLHSVCEEARCPNIGECWEDLTATFMILGDVCTRNCGYCAVTHGRPVWEDREEPERVGRAVRELGLEHVVITSVNRDDLADGGAAVSRPPSAPSGARPRAAASSC